MGNHLNVRIKYSSKQGSATNTQKSAPIGGLLNGGLAGLFWGYIWTFIGFVFIVMSLAEMASMAPTSGGQYHW
jgi:amino acid transporter